MTAPTPPRPADAAPQAPAHDAPAHAATGGSALGRRALLAGAGALALAGGAGLAWWRGSTAPQPAPPELWQTRLARPEGGELALASLRGRPLLLNFWATWCAPCVREMPAFDRFHRAQPAGGVQVVGLAVDSPTPVRAFLKQRPVGFPIALAGLEGAELGRILGNAEGGLPFTVLVSADGRIVQRRLGETREQDLMAWAQAL